MQNPFRLNNRIQQEPYLRTKWKMHKIEGGKEGEYENGTYLYKSKIGYPFTTTYSCFSPSQYKQSTKNKWTGGLNIKAL